MTCTPTSLMRHSFGLCILLATIIARSNGNLSVQTAEYSGVIIQFSPDLLEDHNLVSALRYYKESGEAGLSINLSGSKLNSTARKCIVPFLTVRDNNHVRLSRRPVRRLSDKTVLLTARELEKNETKLVLVNTQSCKYRYAHDGVLPDKRFIFISDNSFDDKYAIIMHGKDSCQGHDWCRLFFDQTFQAIDFDFPIEQFVDVEPATSFDGNLLVVRLTDETDAHRIRMYDLSNVSRYKELFVLESYTNIDTAKSIIQSIFGLGSYTPSPRYEVKSSGLSFCWMLKGRKPIHCSAFKEDGSMKFNQTIVYPDLMDIWLVDTIPNGLVLLSTKSHCVDKEDCSIVHATVIKIDDSNSTPKIEHRQYKFASDFVVALNTRLNESSGNIELEYLCMTGTKGLSYHNVEVI